MTAAGSCTASATALGLQGTIIKGKIRQVIGEVRFEGEEGARMGVPHQAFLILVSPNPLFYDLIKEGGSFSDMRLANSFLTAEEGSN